ATETRARWDHFFDSPPTEIGFGSLHKIATDVDRSWRKPTDRARDAANEARKAEEEARFNRGGSLTPQPNRGAGEGPRTRHPCGGKPPPRGDGADQTEGSDDSLLQDDLRYVIDVVNGQIASVVDEAEKALLKATVEEPIFVRGPHLVRPVVEEIQAHHGMTM